MGVLNDILAADGKSMGIAKDAAALEALAKLREGWSDLRHGPFDANKVIEFVAQLTGDDPGSALSALERAGLDPGVRDALLGIRDAFGKVDAQYGALLSPVATFDEDANHQNPGLVEWKVLGVDKREQGSTATVPSGDYKLDLGLHASLELEAGDTWPDDEPGVPDPLLRIGIAGRMDASGKADVPWSAGTVKLGADATREALIDYYFDVRGDAEPYARAVARRLDALPSPWSLAAVFEALDRPDFEGAVFETKGQAAFSVAVSVADGLALTDETKAELALCFSAKITRGGSYALKLRRLAASPATARALEVTVERRSLDGIESGAELGIDVDLAALGRKLAEVLAPYEAELGGALDGYRDYLQPGTYLRGAASKYLDELVARIAGDPALGSALAAALQRKLGLARTPSGEDFRTLVKQKAADAFDAASGVMSGKIDEVVRELGAAFAVRTGLPASAVDPLGERLHGVVNGLRAELERKLDTTADTQAGQGADAEEEAPQGADAEEGAGAAATKAEAAVEGADAAGARVRDAIARYESALARLRDAVSDAARMKLTAKITTDSRTRGERSVEAKLIFRSASPDAEGVYRDVVRGDFDAILKLLDASVPDVALDPAATSVTAFRSSGCKYGYDLVLLQLARGGSTVFDASSKVVVEGDGRVSVMSELEWKRRTTTPREDREISFVDAYDLLAAKDTHHFTIGLALSHEDQVLKRKEVEGLIRSFERAALLAAGTTERALLQFDEWFGAGDHRGLAADLDFGLHLDGNESARLLCLGDRAGDAVTDKGRRRIFETALHGLIEAGVHTLEYVKNLAEIVQAQSRAVGAKTIVDVLFDYTPQAHRKLLADPSLSPTVNRRRIDDLNRAQALNRLCMSFVALVDLMGEVYTAKPASEKGPGVWTVEDYDAAQRKMNVLLGTWLKTNSRVFWIAPAAHPYTVAFIVAVSALAGVATSREHGVLSLTMTRRNGAPVTATLA